MYIKYLIVVFCCSSTTVREKEKAQHYWYKKYNNICAADLEKSSHVFKLLDFFSFNLNDLALKLYRSCERKGKNIRGPNIIIQICYTVYRKKL